eukprot:754575-Hanusia_phi.AAC.9
MEKDDGRGGGTLGGRGIELDDKIWGSILKLERGRGYGTEQGRGPDNQKPSPEAAPLSSDPLGPAAGAAE